MIWSETKQCWCVLPRHGTGNNLIQVVDWCNERFGRSSIDGIRDGVWSWCGGEFYGITRPMFDQHLPDGRTYLSFKNEEDALVFKLAWC